MRPTALVWTLLVLPLATCANSHEEAEPLAAPSASGTRLDVSVEPGEVPIFDTEAGVECAVTTAADGVTRCLPVGSVLFATGTPYLDASCTRRVEQFSSCHAGARYFLERMPDPSSCGRFSYDVYRAGEQVDGGALFYRREGSACVESQQGLGEGAIGLGGLGGPVRYFAVGEHVPPSEFVALSLDRTPGTAGIGVARFSGEDGSSGAQGFYDMRHGDACFPFRAGDRYFCLARAAYLNERPFADAACTMRAVPRSCAPPDIAIQRPHETHGIADYRGFAVGSEPLTQLYDRRLGSCEPITASEPSPYYLVGDEVAFESRLPELRLRAQGDGRINVHEWTDGHGALLLATARWLDDSQYFDTELARPCAPMEVEGRGSLCLPSMAQHWENGFFADGACAEPVVSCVGSCPSELALRTRLVDGCTTVAEAIHALGSRLESDTVYARRREGVCEVAPVAALGVTWYRLGPETNFDRFAGLDP